jgi:hypothetical protein
MRVRVRGTSRAIMRALQDGSDGIGTWAFINAIDRTDFIESLLISDHLAASLSEVKIEFDREMIRRKTSWGGGFVSWSGLEVRRESSPGRWRMPALVRSRSRQAPTRAPGQPWTASPGLSSRSSIFVSITHLAATRKVASCNPDETEESGGTETSVRARVWQ